MRYLARFRGSLSSRGQLADQNPRARQAKRPSKSLLTTSAVRVSGRSRQQSRASLQSGCGVFWYRGFCSVRTNDGESSVASCQCPSCHAGSAAGGDGAWKMRRGLGCHPGWRSQSIAQRAHARNVSASTHCTTGPDPAGRSNSACWRARSASWYSPSRACTTCRLSQVAACGESEDAMNQYFAGHVAGCHFPPGARPPCWMQAEWRGPHERGLIKRHRLAQWSSGASAVDSRCLRSGCFAHAKCRHRRGHFERSPRQAVPAYVVPLSGNGRG